MSKDTSLDKMALQAEQIVIVNQKEIQKQKLLIGRLILPRGLKLWKLDLMIYQVVESDYKTVLGFARRELVMQEDCIYEVALNIENVQRKFLKKFENARLHNAAESSNSDK